MPSALADELQVLSGSLNGQRQHVFEAIEGLDERDLRRQVLPSGWTLLGLVNHLSHDVERFWFQAVIGGERAVIDDVLTSSDDAWQVPAGDSSVTVLQTYRDNIERAGEIVGTHSLDAAPAWWPDFFGSWRLGTVREIVLHVITETATHAGHLDAARELIDGRLHIVLNR